MATGSGPTSPPWARPPAVVELSSRWRGKRYSTMVKLWCAFAAGAVRPKECVAAAHHPDAPPTCAEPPYDRTGTTTRDSGGDPVSTRPDGDAAAEVARRTASAAGSAVPTPAGCRQRPCARALRRQLPEHRAEPGAHNRLCPGRREVNNLCERDRGPIRPGQAPTTPELGHNRSPASPPSIGTRAPSGVRSPWAIDPGRPATAWRCPPREAANRGLCWSKPRRHRLNGQGP
jgi:hypothetical protein